MTWRRQAYARPARLGLRSGIALLVLLLPGLARPAIAAPTVTIGDIVRVQPGWVRVFLKVTDAPSTATYSAVASCSNPAQANSITTTISTGASLAIDIKDNLAWIADNGLNPPCTVTQIVANMYRVANVIASEATETVNIPMDLPLSHLTPANTTLRPTGTSVALAASTAYAAYPPLILVVQDKAQNISFVEVEELPSRASLGMRGLATFSKPGNTYNLVCELGGGGELQDGWGLDNLAQGIWRAPELPAEISNPGHDVFPYTGTFEPPLLSGNASLKIYPAPPLFTAADYQANVLNNRGVPRCPAPATGCMVVQYDHAHHVLNAVNGATVGVLTPGAIAVGQQTNPPVKPVVVSAGRLVAGAAGRGGVIQSLDAATAARLLTTAAAMAKEPGRNPAVLQAMPTALPGSAARTGSVVATRDYSKIPESIQEQAIEKLLPFQGGPSSVTGSIKPTCIVNAALNGLTQAPSPCSGMHTSPFACPTVADPIKVDELGPPSATAVSLYGTIPPYYAGRDNWYGTCGSHAATQYLETLLNKYSDDLAVKRVIYVNGDPIVVPDPRIALSVTGGTAQWETWDGTHSGDPPGTTGYTATGTNGTMPTFPEAYWPAREPNWSAWEAAAAKTPNNANLCVTTTNPSYWHSGFCIGQGHPGSGVYFSHASQVQSLLDDPLADPPWSLANHWFNYVSTPISLADRDKAIPAVIADIQSGLPVLLSFSPGQSQTTKFGNNQTLSLSSGPTWYLPPELAACTTKQLDGVLGRKYGHAVNIVGFWLAGSAAAPDPVNSYFMLENNWGKTAGYRSFYFINFAAFRYLAYGLTTYRIDRICDSPACAHHPAALISRVARDQLLYPPITASLAAAAYAADLAALHASLSGAYTKPALVTPVSLP